MSKINQTAEELSVSIAYSGLNFKKETNRYFSEDELEQGMQLVLADMEKCKQVGWNVVTFEEICKWLTVNKRYCKGQSSYTIKHLVERDWRVLHKTKYMYCANNWAKYAMVSLGWGFVEKLDGRMYTYNIKPRFEDLMRNDVNWIPDGR